MIVFVPKKKGHLYVITYVMSMAKIPLLEIQHFLELGYQPHDIFVLAPSLRTGGEKNPTRVLENRLVEEGIPCFVPIDDDTELTDTITQGKLAFSSYHQVKGFRTCDYTRLWLR